MTPKIIYARIGSKYDEYENWLQTNPILLQGEIAVAVDPSNTNEDHPKILIKVGDGIHEYKDLPFISSNSIDVPDWAKSNTKPVYTAEEIVGLDQYINNNGGSGGNTGSNPSGNPANNTEYDIIKIDDYTYQFVAKNIGDTEYTKITTIDIPKYPVSSGGIQDITTSSNSGILVTRLDNNIIDISLDKSMVFLLNGGTSTII